MSRTPLSVRVSAPIDNSPVPVAGIEWRPISLDDVDAIVEVNRAIAASDHPHWADTREETLEELSHSYMDLAVDSLAAVTPEGEIVAWGQVIFPPNQDTLVRSILVGGVSPAHRGRGIGRALLEWQHGRARQQLASSSKSLPGWVVVSADRGAEGSAHTIERAGFVPTRWFHGLTHFLGVKSIPEAVTIGGVRIVPFSPGFSAEAHQVRDAAFAGVGSSQAMSDEQWTSMTSMNTAAPEFSFVALDPDDRVIGVLLTLVSEDDWASRGYSSAYIWTLGVEPGHRRTGIGGALLSAHLHAVGVSGIERSMLDVASDDASGGLGLFGRFDYTPQSLSVDYVQVY
jgi:ribosomal protein S18 acetylase RimI-like enzyme